MRLQSAFLAKDFEDPSNEGRLEGPLEGRPGVHYLIDTPWRSRHAG